MSMFVIKVIILLYSLFLVICLNLIVFKIVVKIFVLLLCLYLISLIK